MFAVTWARAEGGAEEEGGPIIDVSGRTLTDGATPLTPLVWASQLASPAGVPLPGLRVVNRTDHYRCKSTGIAWQAAVARHAA